MVKDDGREKGLETIIRIRMLHCHNSVGQGKNCFLKESQGKG